MRSRIVIGLCLGVSGICLGTAGAIFGVPVLGIIAAICAVVGCFVIAGETLLPLLKTVDDEPVFEPLTDSRTIDAVMSSNETVIDPITELPDRRYFEVAVDGRVAAARRHLWPVSIVLVELAFEKAEAGSDLRNRSLVKFADLMRQTLREADIACRLSDNTFGLILEDTSEEGGVWTAERLQIALSHDETTIVGLAAGVAAYPTHGLYAKDVLVRARAALHRAATTPAGHGLGQVEVAHVDLS